MHKKSVRSYPNLLWSVLEVLKGKLYSLIGKLETHHLLELCYYKPKEEKKIFPFIENIRCITRIVELTEAGADQATDDSTVNWNNLVSLCTLHCNRPHCIDFYLEAKGPGRGSEALQLASE